MARRGPGEALIAGIAAIAYVTTIGLAVSSLDHDDEPHVVVDRWQTRDPFVHGCADGSDPYPDAGTDTDCEAWAAAYAARLRPLILED